MGDVWSADAAVTALMGALIDQFGVGILPKVLAVPALIGLLLVSAATYRYSLLLKRENAAFATEEAKYSADAGGCKVVSVE